ncbi:coiled-coil domain-containing protein 120 isoform X2 [Bombina bombina]|uniref:coiled-coil domain-containing protein 120 isoform X2 n=1 Tax=Bombina bombina TaxID=8345 RepID=UPI00235A4758|nr:coiled-coil domain-containing protein 120 isoform X2 [Bombina bombina]
MVISDGAVDSADKMFPNMEVKGHLISPCGVPTTGGSSYDLTPNQRAQLLSELTQRQQDLQETLRQRVNELKRLCLQEAELTGQIPADYPLEYGERPPHVTRRPRAVFRVSAAVVTRAEEVQLERLERDFAVQLQMTEAARKLSLAAEQSVEMTVEQRRKRRLVYLDALRRLQELEEQSNNLRRKLGLRTTHRVPHNLPEDMINSGLRPSPPRISEPSRAMSSSPERRVCWKTSPAELYCEIRNRRNSMASTASPTRSFPRSLSSLEGRSVPATPILSRSACSSSALRCEGSGLSQPQWSGSQDSQIGFPNERPPLHSSRNRRSNSSEALIERPPHEEPPGKPSFKSSEALSENIPPPQHGPPQIQRGARSPDPRAPNSSSRLPYEDILMDYYIERQQQQARGWAEPEGHWWIEPENPWWVEQDGSGHYSRRDGYYEGYPGSPALRSRAETQQRRNAARTKSCGPQLPAHFQQPWHQEGFPQRSSAQHPGPRSRSQPRGPAPEALERSVHKALALEGLRDWYLRNAAATGGSNRGPATQQYQRYYRPGYHDGHYQTGSPLPHSISFTGAPLHDRYEMLY